MTLFFVYLGLAYVCFYAGYVFGKILDRLSHSARESQS